MAMREKYTKKGASIHYFLVDWEPEKLSWADFRLKVLGATDPATAEEGSLRREIFQNWKSLGLKAEPNVGDNGVHASASPFEALAERVNWLGATLEDDPFGSAMLSSGISKSIIMDWTKDPQVRDPDPASGKKASLFDLLEDLDYDACLEKAQLISGVSKARPAGKMQAYVFIKPHAVTDQTKALVSKRFQSAGIKVYDQGSLDAATIEKDKLIDNHYYAIANKASLSKQSELNPPAPKLEDFEKKFGISWKDALARGIVFNAVDACKHLGIDGEQMDRVWGKTKKAGDMVKFGGGFYAARIPVAQV
jgi:nucleoside diphosphate kinase